MQKYDILISELAEQDLENVGDYVAEVLKNPKAAVDTIRGIRRMMGELQCFPERYELDVDPVIADYGVRSACYRNYKIYYIVKNSTVFIIRILHTLMNARMWIYRSFRME